jgi:hypothetical protein
MLIRVRLVRPEAGRLCTRMPPQVEDPVCPGPFPVIVVFLMSNAALFSKMPPPGEPVTMQVSMWRVTDDPESGDALTPMPVLGLASPWMVRLRRVTSPEVMVMQSAPAVGVNTALLFPTITRGDETDTVVTAAANVPLTMTTDLDPDFAMLMPLPRLHTGAAAVPALLSLHELTGPT